MVIACYLLARCAAGLFLAILLAEAVLAFSPGRTGASRSRGPVNLLRGDSSGGRAWCAGAGSGRGTLWQSARSGSSTAASEARCFPASLGREITFGSGCRLLPCWWESATWSPGARLAAETPAHAPALAAAAGCPACRALRPLLSPVCSQTDSPARSPPRPPPRFGLGVSPPGPAQPRGSRGAFGELTRGGGVAQNVVLGTETNPA